MTLSDLENALGELQYLMDAACYYRSLDAIIPRWEDLQPATRQRKIKKALDWLEEWDFDAKYNDYSSGNDQRTMDLKIKAANQSVRSAPEYVRCVTMWIEEQMRLWRTWNLPEQFEREETEHALQQL